VRVLEKLLRCMDTDSSLNRAVNVKIEQDRDWERSKKDTVNHSMARFTAVQLLVIKGLKGSITA